MKVAVAGLWHLGPVTAACLASAGYRVLGFDETPETVEALKSGRLPVDEPGLALLTREGLANGHLQFSCDPRDIKGSEIVWIAYDTPVDEHDQADSSGVIGKIEALFRHLQDGTLVLVSSQLPVGSTRKLEEMFREAEPNKAVHFAYSPENLRLGKAIEVFTKPERIVVGVRTLADKERIAALLEPFTSNIEWMSVESAEMTKHALNAFLATSVVFINEVAVLCEQVGADAREVERGLKSDVRIGRGAYLRPGGAFAGGTLARDVTYLIERSEAVNRPVHLLRAVRSSNDEHRRWACRKLQDVFSNLAGRSVAAWGLTYKPGTDTLRRSAAVETCRLLQRQGVSVTAYDPAIKRLPDDLAGLIDLRSSMEEAARGGEAVLVATTWPEFQTITADKLVSWMTRPIVLDEARFLESQLGRDQRIRYFAVGTGG